MSSVTWYSKVVSESVKEKSIFSGTGIGIRIPIPLIESIRIDLAWGLYNGEFQKKPVLHFALQQKF